MTDEPQEYATLPVRLVEAPPVRRERVRSVYRIVTLTTDDQTSLALPQSENRICAYIQALDDDIVISNNESDAEAGAGCRVLAANLAPWPIYDHDAVYVGVPTLTGPTARVSVSASYRVVE